MYSTSFHFFNLNLMKVMIIQLIFCSSILKMEAVGSSEMLVNTLSFISHINISGGIAASIFR